MLSRLLAYCGLLQSSAFDQMQPVRAVAVEQSHTLTAGLAAPDGEGVEDIVNKGTKSTHITNLHRHISGLSKRLLQMSITDSTSLQTATTAWCQNSAQAALIYGDIATW